MPLYSLILAWTLDGATVVYPPTNFASRDLCEAAATEVERDITTKGGRVHIARCVLVSLAAR